ncbi:unnamed protein product [Caenorhabditis bovis]|uniref:acetyl-CoA carboxylase n=1 Tax=Caenorhabditis bovis TaxID=2654633 RepID=A0A8S1F4X4_9PELO|nr:unnamed protein product [Caenorhabditis bovis]
MWQSLEEFAAVKKAKRTIRRILVANNGLAAMKCIISIREWLQNQFDNDGIIKFICMVNDDELDAGSEYLKLADEVAITPSGSNIHNFANLDLILSLAIEKEADAVFNLNIPVVRWSGSHIKENRHLEEYNFYSMMRQSMIETEEEGLECIKKNSIQFPIMIKASEGGGGKGIRKCTHETDFSKCFNEVKLEVPHSPIFLMNCVQNARHIEVQIIGDKYGDIISLFSRDCTTQRRCQKVIEEAPASLVSPEILKKMEQDSIKFAKFVKYHSAGTVEFLYVHETKKYYFMEFNPRLQVEHPCTEMISNLNIPAIQLQIAMGIRLKDIDGLSKIDAPNGHAISARITCEDPDDRFLPCVGRVFSLNHGFSRHSWGYFSVSAGSAVHDHADSQIGHVFAKGATRHEAILNLKTALKSIRIEASFPTQTSCLVDLLSDKKFFENHHDVQWLDERIANGAQKTKFVDLIAISAAAIGRNKINEIFERYEQSLRDGRIVLPNDLKRSVDVELQLDHVKYSAKVFELVSGKYGIRLNGQETFIEILGSEATNIAVHNGSSFEFHFETVDSFYLVKIGNNTLKFRKDYNSDARVLESPYTGKFLEYIVNEGDLLNVGDAYARVESMKMVFDLLVEMAPGRIQYVAREGDIIHPGAVVALLDIDTDKQANIEEFSGNFQNWKPLKLGMIEEFGFPFIVDMIDLHLNSSLRHMIVSQIIELISKLPINASIEQALLKVATLTWIENISNLAAMKLMSIWLPNMSSRFWKKIQIYCCSNNAIHLKEPLYCDYGAYLSQRYSDEALKIYSHNLSLKTRYIAQKNRTVSVFDILILFAGVSHKMHNEKGYDVQEFWDLIDATEMNLNQNGQLEFKKVAMKVPQYFSRSSVFVWIVRLLIPGRIDPLEFILIANDISYCAGSFSVSEHAIFEAASQYARKHKIPRVNISSNSGARIGIDSQVLKKMKVKTTRNNDFEYNYLEDEEKVFLENRIDCERVEDHWRLISIKGTHDEPIGVENLMGSARIATETSRAYSEIPTYCYVTGRSVGIGAYTARLARRIVQHEKSQIILTGADALNTLLGKKIYASNNRIGGVEVMKNNGIAHAVVSSDFEGFRKIVEWLLYIPKKISSFPFFEELLNAETNSTVQVSPDEMKNDVRSVIDGIDEKQGIFDCGSFDEICPNWAKSIVVGRARIHSMPCGVIASQWKSITFEELADEALETSKATKIERSAQVWYPDSAYKTSQAISDFNKEGLPLVIIANLRGFSGGRKDMSMNVLNFGANIIDELSQYSQPVIVYIPSGGELRGGAWAVLDSQINPGFVHLVADRESRGGVLEPSAIVSLKIRSPVLEAIMENSGVSKDQTNDSIKQMFKKGALKFADMHDTWHRMKFVGAVEHVVTLSETRNIFYKIIRNEMVRLAMARRLLCELKCIRLTIHEALDRLENRIRAFENDPSLDLDMTYNMLRRYHKNQFERDLIEQIENEKTKMCAELSQSLSRN